MDKIEIHKQICNKLHDTYKAKNADYGDSFAKLRKEYPNAILIRLTDKLNRLKTLMGGSVQKVSDESIDDSLLDLANYCILELVERQDERPQDRAYKGECAEAWILEGETTKPPTSTATKCRTVKTILKPKE